MIKGITIDLYNRQQAGVDPFGVPIYTETVEQVDNVLVAPAQTDDLISDVDLHGKRIVYNLHLPKGDDHYWIDRKVGFFGRLFRTVGIPQEYIEANVPLSWNRIVRAESYEEAGTGTE